ncbi:MAG: hypothetical protein HOP06_03445 [Methylotenera sp.]|nr:hypothetical protein [Methylotenera sp.]
MIFKLFKKTQTKPEAALIKTNEALFKRVNALYEEGRKKKDPEVFRDNIRLAPERVRTIVEYLQDMA